jgi:hypothetical protein
MLLQISLINADNKKLCFGNFAPSVVDFLYES